MEWKTFTSILSIVGEDCNGKKYRNYLYTDTHTGYGYSFSRNHADILDVIDTARANEQPVYVHCWGGKGRTGTVVGCYLVRHGLALGEDALKEIKHLRRHDPKADESSPENESQCNFVRSWQQGQ